MKMLPHGGLVGAAAVLLPRERSLLARVCDNGYARGRGLHSLEAMGLTVDGRPTPRGLDVDALLRGAA